VCKTPSVNVFGFLGIILVFKAILSRTKTKPEVHKASGTRVQALYYKKMARRLWVITELFPA
jgi:hypothetical protein